MMDSNELTQLSEEIIQRLGTGADLDGIISNEIFPNSEIYLDETNDGDNEPDDVIILHMDIREPLRALQRLIELKIGVNLKGYSFWLQDVQELEPHKNLVDQCVKGEGLVQINVQIQTIAQRINIMDVLKPTEAALAALGVEETSMETEQQTNTTDDDREIPFESQESDADHEKYDEQSQEKPCLNWVLDSKFKKEQSRLKIPEDPMEWSVSQVKHWFQWAVRQFNLTNVNMLDWVMKGSELCALTHEEFRRKMPKDPGNVFWIHLQLLKECKFVSVIHKAAENNAPNLKLEKLDNNNDNNENSSVPRELKIMRSKGQIQGDGSPTHVTSPNAYGVGSGNNGQVQLWQFLLELLTDREHTSIIQWVGSEGEFKLIDPERVARLWGEKKNKPAMNYEKLSRALRYYYDGDMISKVSGKRFAYKFDCDLKLLIGYNAEELSALVNEKSVVKIATEADFSTKSDKDDDDNSEED